MTTDLLPAAMIEAAARAMADHDEDMCDFTCGDECPYCSAYRATARTALAAALSVCEVRPEYWRRVAGAEGWWNWFGLKPLAGDKYRLVITTPGGEL